MAYITCPSCNKRITDKTVKNLFLSIFLIPSDKFSLNMGNPPIFLVLHIYTTQKQKTLNEILKFTKNSKVITAGF